MAPPIATLSSTCRPPRASVAPTRSSLRPSGWPSVPWMSAIMPWSASIKSVPSSWRTPRLRLRLGKPNFSPMPKAEAPKGLRLKVVKIGAPRRNLLPRLGSWQSLGRTGFPRSEKAVLPRKRCKAADGFPPSSPSFRNREFGEGNRPPPEPTSRSFSGCPSR